MKNKVLLILFVTLIIVVTIKEKKEINQEVTVKENT